MSDDNSDDEDSVSNIDFSVISRAIEASGKMVQQILNGIHYGTPEVRDLLYNQADFIVECRVCRNLFRSIPNFVAHKRIYCLQSIVSDLDDLNLGLSSSQDREETIVVEPQTPPEPSSSHSVLDSSSSNNNEKHGMTTNNETPSRSLHSNATDGETAKQGEVTGGGSTLKQLLTGTFKGKSSAYNLYTKLAQKAELQKSSKTLSTITMTPIPTNQNAAFIKVTENVELEMRPLAGQRNEVVGTVKSIETDKRENNKTSPVGKIFTRDASDVNKSKEILISGKSALQRKLEQKNKKYVELRPVKSKVGSQQVRELMELGLLGHCDLSRYTCALCSTKYSSRKSILQHMHAKHSGRKIKYPCTICSKSFSYMWGVTRHLQQNHNKSKLQIDKLRPHIKAKAFECHDEEEEEEEDDDDHRPRSLSSPEKQENNQLISLTKSTEGQPVKHNLRKNPTGIKLNKCDGCGKAFWKRSNYDDHLQQCKWLLPSAMVSKVSPNKYRSGTRVITKTLGENSATASATKKLFSSDESVQAKSDSETRDIPSSKQGEHQTRSLTRSTGVVEVSESRTRSQSKDPKERRENLQNTSKSTAGGQVVKDSAYRHTEDDNHSASDKVVPLTLHTVDHEHQTRSKSKDVIVGNLNSDKSEDIKKGSSRQISSATSVEHKTRSQVKEGMDTDKISSTTDAAGIGNQHRTRSQTKEGSDSDKTSNTINVAGIGNEHKTRSHVKEGMDTGKMVSNEHKTRSHVKEGMDTDKMISNEHKTRSHVKEGMDTDKMSCIHDVSGINSEHSTRSRDKHKDIASAETGDQPKIGQQTRSDAKDDKLSEDVVEQETEIAGVDSVTVSAEEISELEKQLQLNDGNSQSLSISKAHGKESGPSSVVNVSSVYNTRSHTKDETAVSGSVTEKAVLEKEESQSKDTSDESRGQNCQPSVNNRPDSDSQVNSVQAVMLPIKPTSNMTNVVKKVQSPVKCSATESGFVPRYVVLNKTAVETLGPVVAEVDKETTEEGMDVRDISEKSLEAEEESIVSKITDKDNVNDGKECEEQSSKSSPGPQKSPSTTPKKKQSPVQGQSSPAPLLMKTRRSAAMDKESNYMRTRFFDKRRESHITTKTSPLDKGDRPKTRRPGSRDVSDERKRSCNISPSPSKSESVDSRESSQDRSTRLRDHSDSSRDSSQDRSRATETDMLLESGSERSRSRKQKFLARTDPSQSKDNRDSSSDTTRSRSDSRSVGMSDRTSVQTRTSSKDTNLKGTKENENSKNTKLNDMKHTKNDSHEVRISTRRTAAPVTDSSNSKILKEKSDEKSTSAERMSTRSSVTQDDVINQPSKTRIQTRGGNKTNIPDEKEGKDSHTIHKAPRTKSLNEVPSVGDTTKDRKSETASQKKSSKSKVKQDLKNQSEEEDTDSSYILSENVLNQFMTDEVDGNIYTSDRMRPVIKGKAANRSLKSQYEIKETDKRSFLGMNVSPHVKGRQVKGEGQGQLRQYKIVKVQGQKHDSSASVSGIGTAQKNMPSTRNITRRSDPGIQNKTVLSIQEIWVQKEPGQPIEEVCTNKILVTEDNTPTPEVIPPSTSQTRSSERIRSNRMYVVDPKEASQARCLDFNRVERLSDEVACKCLQCDMSFKCVANLRRHVVRHLGWRRYKCKLCKFSSYMKSECNTHLIRSHADKLLSCSAGSMIIDLNKEASRVRSQKKQKTIQEKQEEGNKGIKVKSGSSWSKYFRGRSTRFNSIRTAATHQQKTGAKKQPQVEKVLTRSRRVMDKSSADDTKQDTDGAGDNAVKESRRRKSHTPIQVKDVQEKTVSTRRSSVQGQTNVESQEKDVVKKRKSVQGKKESGDIEKNSKLETMETDSLKEAGSTLDDTEERKLRKRKRSNSEDCTGQRTHSEAVEGDSTVKTDQDVVDTSPPPKARMKRSVSLDGGIEASGIQEELSVSEAFEIPSVSDYENSDSEIVYSPPVAKMTPNLNTMMTALEEARAFQFVRRRGRGRRISPPFRRIQRVSSTGATSGSRDSATRLSLDSAASQMDASENKEDNDLGKEETTNDALNPDKSTSGKEEFSEFETTDIVFEKSSECSEELLSKVLPKQSRTLRSHSAKPESKDLCESDTSVKDSCATEMKTEKAELGTSADENKSCEPSSGLQSDNALEEQLNVIIESKSDNTRSEDSNKSKPLADGNESNQTANVECAKEEETKIN